MKIVTVLVEHVRRPGLRLVAVDPTIASVFGDKIYRATSGYNPHKPEHDSYHPLLAVDAATRSVGDGYFRPGVCASAYGLDGSIRKFIIENPHLCEQTVFRLDKGHTCESILDTIAFYEAGDVAKAKRASKMIGKIIQVKKGPAFRKGHSAANVRCLVSGWKQARRMMRIWRKLPPRNPDAQLPLCKMLESCYEVVVTYLHLNAEGI
jgi:hypothetical protein